MKKYDIRKNWLETLDLIKEKPVVIMPFIIVAFLEALALELIYFSTRYPISLIANPITRKFFGEAFLHYPGNMVLLPRLFYYAQVVIYVSVGVFLTAISVNMFKNIKAGLPLKTNALVKNALKNYFSFFIYGLIIVILLFAIRKSGLFIFPKIVRLSMKLIPGIPEQVYYSCLTLSLFFINLIVQTFLILTVPIIVIDKNGLIKALVKSIYLAVRNFLNIFGLLLLPFLIYLPLTLLKSFSIELVDKTFPEINLYITLAGVIITVFLDSFIILCISEWLLDYREGHKIKS